MILYKVNEKTANVEPIECTPVNIGGFTHVDRRGNHGVLGFDLFGNEDEAWERLVFLAEKRLANAKSYLNAAKEYLLAAESENQRAMMFLEDVENNKNESNKASEVSQ